MCPSVPRGTVDLLSPPQRPGCARPPHTFLPTEDTDVCLIRHVTRWPWAFSPLRAVDFTSNLTPSPRKWSPREAHSWSRVLELGSQGQKPGDAGLPPRRLQCWSAETERICAMRLGRPRSLRVKGAWRATQQRADAQDPNFAQNWDSRAPGVRPRFALGTHNAVSFFLQTLF